MEIDTSGLQATIQHVNMTNLRRGWLALSSLLTQNKEQEENKERKINAT